MKIKKIDAYEIIASGGFPTLEVQVWLESGVQGKASVPYGASAGSHEASVLVDGGTRFLGKGMQQAVQNVLTKIAPQVIGKDFSTQQEIDNLILELDPTPQKAELGGNVILAVSVAAARAAANHHQLPLFRYLQQSFDLPAADYLPNPMIVAIEGGKHAHNSTDLQEYCITGLEFDQPKMVVLQKLLETYHHLKKVLVANNLSVNVGNEGAFAPDGITSNQLPLDYLVTAINQAGYTAGNDIGISIDAAASEFYQDGKYHLKVENRVLSSKELSEYYRTWLQKYPIVTLEDMHHEDDWQAWQDFLPVVQEFGAELIGDDLTVTSSQRLQKAIDLNAITAILIKLNQIGSVTETVQTCQLAAQHGLATVPSHRGGGETNDTAMVDVAVAVGAKFIKAGPTRGERVAKYNRLLQIERIN